jgi:muramoyltetrapeptide carboxypeptidase
MWLPRPLLPGGRIGICAPAGPVKEERLRAAIEALRAENYDVVTAPSAFARDGLFAAPDDVRRRELQDMFTRPDVDAVFCARGGVGSSRLLSELDTALIARARKPFLGFSDITVLQWLLGKRHQFVSFSGPLAVEWSDGVSPSTRRRALDLLGGRAKGDLLNGFPRDDTRALHGGKVRGPLWPGNLTMIATLLGTPFLPDLSGAVLLVEDVNEPPHRVDRLLFHLRNSGILNGIGALLAGDLESGEEGDLKGSVARALADVTRGLNIPVALGLPYGHGPERVTLPVGALLEWDSDNATLTLCEPVTEVA